MAVTIGVVAASLSAPARGRPSCGGGGSGVWSTPANWLTSAAPTTGDVATFSGWAPLSRTGWVASASGTNAGDAAANAIDGLQSARWSTGANQAVGQWFKVDMGSTQTFTGISLDSGTNTISNPYTVTYTESLNGSVSAISYDADSGQYMASTSSGRLVYLPATP